MVQLLMRCPSKFLFMRLKTTLTDCSLTKDPLNAAVCFCRLTVTFSGLLFKAWGLCFVRLLVRGGG